MKRPFTRLYRAFLIRLWREGEQGPWRAEAENPHTGEHRAFADLRMLFEFLADSDSAPAAGQAEAPPPDERPP